MGGKSCITFLQTSDPTNKCLFVLVRGALHLSLQNENSRMAPEYTDGRFILYFPQSFHTVFSYSQALYCWTHTDI